MRLNWPVADAKDKEPPARLTPAQRQQAKREEKLAHVQEELESGRMTTSRLSPEEMAAHAARQAERAAKGTPKRKR